MTLHFGDLDVQHEALADYSMLIKEEAVVLSALAEATRAEERAEELTELHAIHDEGSRYHDHSPLGSSLHRLFDAVDAVGESMVGQPPRDLDRVHAIELLTRALATCLDSSDGTPALDSINVALRRLDPGFAGALDLPAAVAAAADQVEALR